MADNADYNADKLNQAATQDIWDPISQTTVPQSYAQDNPQDYQGYTGTVGYDPGGGIPLNASAFGIDTGAPVTPASQYQTDFQQALLNPYDTTNLSQYQTDVNAVASNVETAPGVQPNLGYLPGYGAVDVGAGYVPLNWGLPQAGGGAAADPFDVAYLNNLAANNVANPTFASQSPGEMPNFGRGFILAGQPSPEEQALTEAYLNGQPVDMNRLIGLRQARIQAKQPSTMQKIAHDYYAPFLASLGGIATAGVGGLGGAALGAGWGTFASGAQSKFQNPGALAAGAAGGFAGGVGGGALGQAAGVGPVATGTLVGAGTAAGRDLAQYGVNGQFNGQALGRDIALGGLAGGIGGALKPTLGPIGPMIGKGMTQAIGPFIPGLQPPQPPPIPRRTQAQQLNPYNR